jgi:iron complex outermembrane receptor protein
VTAKLITKTALAAAGSVAALSASSQARAQDATPTDATPTTDSKRPAENVADAIIVTAQRRAENQQRVPVAVTTISPETLEANNVNSLADLSYLVPSLSPPSGRTRDVLVPSIRGQGINLSGIPGVIQYINEVPAVIDNLGQAVSGAGLYYDIRNIQVLKGPQGTLFGRNAVGGAILYETRRPEEEFGGYVQAGIGNYQNRELTGVVNAPLVKEKLLVRIAFNGQRRDGYTKLVLFPSLERGHNLDDVHYNAARVSVRFKPVEEVTNDLIVDVLDSKTHGMQTALNTNDNAGFPSFIPWLGPDGSTWDQAALWNYQQTVGPRTQVDFSGKYFSNRKLFTLVDILSADLSDSVQFRNIFGYMNSRTNFNINFGPLVYIVEVPQSLKQYTEELQLQGQTGRLQWTIGSFYLMQPKGDWEVSPVWAFSNGSAAASKQMQKSFAIYGQGTVELSSLLPGLSLTAGARYTWDKREGLTSGPLTFEGECTTAPFTFEACGSSAKSSSKAPTWAIALNYQATDKILVYATNRRGYRTGGYQTTRSKDVSTFDPEYVTDYELGLKADWDLGGMPGRTNIAAYYQDYTKIQVTESIIDPQTGLPDFLTGNAGGARLVGGELEGFIRPTSRLKVGILGSYLSWKFTEFGPDVINPAALKAEPNRGYPHFQLGGNLAYELPVPERVGKLLFGANLSWVSSSKNLKDPTPGGFVKAWSYTNFSLSWDRMFGSNWDSSFYMTNAFDKLHNGGVRGNPPDSSLYPLGLQYSLAAYDAPRMYGARLRYNFGNRQ